MIAHCLVQLTKSGLRFPGFFSNYHEDPPMLIRSLFTALFFLTCPLFSQVLDNEGDGFLEIKEKRLVIHLKGSPYDRGYQHGRLLKDQIAANIANYIDVQRPGAQERTSAFLENVPKLLSYTPDSYKEEMQGLADGSGIPLAKIQLLNLFPEMFHCSAITVTGDAAQDGELYHVRVLDYSIGKKLQNTAVLMVVEPDNANAYLNVSYAGFIGSVTGMNAEKIAVGEIGGLGYGQWDGMPMSFLIREILEKASTIDEAKQILHEANRTCEYFYILSDGKTKESCGVYATSSQLHFIQPGVAYAFFNQNGVDTSSFGKDDKVIYPESNVSNSSFQTLMLDANNKSIGFINTQPQNCLLLTGFSDPGRYSILAERIQAAYGSINAFTLMEAIKRPVAHVANLHNAIFVPAKLQVWISHAGRNDEPACDEPYSLFSLTDLLQD